jgi:hypothetical protein
MTPGWTNKFIVSNFEKEQSVKPADTVWKNSTAIRKKSYTYAAARSPENNGIDTCTRQAAIYRRQTIASNSPREAALPVLKTS